MLRRFPCIDSLQRVALAKAKNKRGRTATSTGSHGAHINSVRVEVHSQIQTAISRGIGEFRSWMRTQLRI